MSDEFEARLIRIERAVGNMATLLLEMAVERQGIDLRHDHPQQTLRRSIGEIFPWRRGPREEGKSNA